jgi:RNA methyltransferase, TrmH family
MKLRHLRYHGLGALQEYESALRRIIFKGVLSLGARANGRLGLLMPSPTIRERLRPITGRHNPLLKDLRAVYTHGNLTDDGCFAVEGVRSLEEAIRSSVRFRAVFFADADDAATQRLTQRLLEQIGHKVETYLVPAKLFHEAIATDSPQGVAALVRRKESTLNEALREKPALVVVAAGLQDPGNLGTILRSAEAFGAGGVVVSEGTVSAYNPKTVRATAGSIFRVPVITAKLAELIPHLRENRVKLFATSSHKGTPLHEAPLHEPSALFIGNEGAGLPRDVVSKMDATLAIPQARPVESLNAGVAASIILYEAARQRGLQQGQT